MDTNQDKADETNGPGTTHFGHKTVREEEKAGLVRGVFDAVANRYDVMNDAMSGGVHRLWKDQMVTWANPKPGQTVIDMAGGTGDISFRILDRMGVGVDDANAVMVCDINAKMLEEGRARADQRWRNNKPVPNAWFCTDAEHLPFPDASADLYTIAFGIRNVTHIDQALRDAYRALKLGGRFLCLEFSKPQVPVLDDLYEFYSFQIIPRMGSAIAGDKEAYAYLVESIRRFPDQKTFAGMIAAAGFKNVKVRNLTGGIAALHSGWKV